MLAFLLLALSLGTTEQSTSPVRVLLPSPEASADVTVLALPERGPKAHEVKAAGATVVVLLANPKDEQPWALAGPSWVSEPVISQPPELIRALPARRWQLSLASASNMRTRPSFLRLLPLDEKGLPAGPLWAYPVLWEEGRARVWVPEGKWHAFLYVAGAMEVDLGPLPDKGELPSRQISLKPGAGLAFRISQHPASPSLVWPFPKERWQDLYCAATGPGLQQVAGGVWVERGGWVRVAFESAGSLLVAGEVDGMPPQLWGPFRVEVGQETQGGVVTPGSASLDVVVPGSKPLVTNPLHQLDVLVWPTVLGEFSKCVQAQRLSELENAAFAGLFPGFWFVEVVGQVKPSVSGGVLTRREVVELRPGEHRTLVLPLRFSLVKGRIHHQGEPAHCLLEVRVEDGEGKEHKTAGWSYPNGTFYLPGVAPGVGEVVVRCLKPQTKTTIAPVEVAANEPLDLEIPGGEITGTVVDGKGLPLAGWEVQARWLTTAPVGESVAFERYNFTRTTNPQGAFRFPYLAPGMYRLLAISPEGWKSPPVFVELASGNAQRKVTLKVEEEKKALRLRVPGSGGRFSLFALPRPGSPMSLNDLGTWGEIPADGLVRLPFSLDTVAEVFLEVVLPPPRGVWCGALHPQWWRAQDTVELTIPDVWGSLEIRYRGGGGKYPPLWLMAQDGAVCEIFLLSQGINPPAAVWEMQNARIFIPALAPGLYQVLAAPGGLTPEILAARKSASAPWVAVTPGALTSLEVSF
ncbi:MAG: hypothetical protein KatS3mg007_2113 [Thermoanaerobaculum sp.]|nr:MAG: hypothetical protein KatS3mg007_2113 [Thermoanaerobaculum sp.]